jgi:small GTP-binding protein
MSELDAKVVFLGAAGVGKTCIICRSLLDRFDANMRSSVGAYYSPKRIILGNGVVNLQIWDTAGQERFRTVAPFYYRGAVIAVLVFSLVEESTLDELRRWANEVLAQGNDLPVLFVVGNKLDLIDSAANRPGESIAIGLGAVYFEVSAKSGQGINELFLAIAEQAHKRLRTPAHQSKHDKLEPEAARKKWRFC